MTEDLNESMDLSDNELTRLENIPTLTRLKCLLISNNRITRIAPDIGANLPALTALVLTNNKISSIQDLMPLGTLSNTLTDLVLRGNPVTKMYVNYRVVVAALLPKLEMLDYEKISQSERAKASQIAALLKQPNATLNDVAIEVGVGSESMTDALGMNKSGPGRPQETKNDKVSSTEDGKKGLSKLPPESIKAIRERIKRTTSLEEISTLATILKTGEIPPGFVI